MEIVEKWFCDFLDKHLRWEQYRAFFNLVIFRYLVMWFAMVPIIVGILSDINSPVIFFDAGGVIHEINLVLPFSWQLLWLASFLFVIALFIYYLRAPVFVRKYHNFSFYKDYYHDYRWLVWEADKLVNSIKGTQVDKFIVRLLEKEVLEKVNKEGFEDKLSGNNTSIVVEKLHTSLYFKHNDEIYTLYLPRHLEDSKNINDQVGVFYEIYGRYSSSRHCSRFLILLLLTFSGIVFLLVLGQHIYHGGSYFFDWVSELCFNGY
ncbi:hypothetical protein [Vibrio owensii]